MMTKKIRILDTDYDVYVEKLAENPRFKECDGYFDPSDKTIHLCELEEDEMNVSNLNGYKLKVFHHEIIHAFLYECGLDVQSDWARNEEMVDFFAIQFDKLRGIFDKNDAHFLKWINKEKPVHISEGLLKAAESMREVFKKCKI